MIQSKVKIQDDCQLATFYALNYENLKHKCLTDPDLPQFRDLPDKLNLEAKVDMNSLDQFLHNIESVNFCLEKMGVGTQKPGSRSQK